MAEGLEGRVLLSAALVQDLNPGTLGSSLSPVFALGSHDFFYTNYPAPSSGSSQLWETDGTEAGTAPATDLAAKVGRGVISAPTAFAGSTWFVQNGQLWRSDGTSAGTSAVTTLGTGPGVAGIAGDKLILNDAGTLLAVNAAGQRSVLRNVPDNYAAFTEASNDSTVYFLRGDYAAGEQELWSTDGTAAGTHLIKSGFDITQVLLAADPSGGVYLFDPGTGPRHGLWKSEGTAAGTSLISPVFGAANNSNQLAVVGDTVFFSGHDDAQGTALWKSDGTPTGTSLLEQIDPVLQPNSPQFVNFSTANNLLLFYVYDADPQLSGLWRSDGTPAGTFMLQTFGFPLPQQYPVVFGNSIYLSGNDGVHGTQLWKSDGTAAGTQIASLINPFESANPQQISLANGRIFLTADDGIHGSELWTSDGTAASTRLVKDINTQPASSNPTDIVQFDGKAYFEAIDRHGPQLWSSDGTTAGTAPVTSLSLYETGGTDPRTLHIGNLTEANGSLYFTTAAGNLWKTDGTAAGTIEVFDAQSTRLSPLTNLTAVGNTLVFVTYERDENGFALSTQLWKTDGTPAGTTRLATWPQPTNFSWTFRSTVLANAMIFQVMNGNELQLWRSDGTVGGTTLLTNFSRPGSTINWDPDLLASAGVVGNTLYFIDSEKDTDGSGNTVTYHDLWTTDGTPAGTRSIVSNFPYNPKRFIDLNGSAVFLAASSSGTGLYRIDNPPAGASFVAPIPVSPFALGAEPDVVLGGKLYVLGGTKLVRSDGTAAGTVPVINLSHTAWPNVGTLSGLTAADGMLYFFSYAPSNGGAQLWESDGTAAGTIPVAGISPGPQTVAGNAGLLEGPPTLAANRLFFSANDGVHADELWAADISVAGSIFDDANHNGLRDLGEAVLSGVTVYIDANNNGKLDPGELSTLTDANGNYAFNGLAPGNDVIRQVLPAGFSQTTSHATAPAATIGATTAGPIFGDVLVSSVPLDFSMLLNLARHYGQSGTFNDGDLNGDGTVNFDDLLLLAQNYAGSSNAANGLI